MKKNICLKSFLYLGSVISVIFSVTGCRESDLPQLKGRYQGFEDYRGNKYQVIAEVPDYVSVGESKTVNFKVYPTLGSSRGISYKISIFDETKIELQSGYVLQPVILKRNENCAFGDSNLQKIKACWDRDQIEVEIAEQGSVVISLKLKRDDNLPPAKDILSREYTLDELMGRAKFLNYKVSQDAEKVFQARQGIAVARGNLLPKLNVRAVVGVFTGDFMSAVGSALPFLFPSNWFKWLESKEMFQAERLSFASLRGNEMNFVEGLYFVILRDQVVLDKLSKQIDWLKTLQKGMAVKETTGSLPTGTSDYFASSIAPFEKDKLSLQTLIKMEYSFLSQAVALPASNAINSLAPIPMPDLSKIIPVDGRDFFRDAQLKSYEAKALNYLVEATKYAQGEIWFSFMDVEGNGGLGFGTPNQILINKSEQSNLRKKVEEMYSLIESRSVDVAAEHNQALDNYRIATNGFNQISKRTAWLINRHLNGDVSLNENDFVDQLVDLQVKLIGFAADQVTATQVWLTSKSKLDRLLLNGFYDDLEAALPEDKTIE